MKDCMNKDIFLATPCMGDVDYKYHMSCLKLNSQCLKEGYRINHHVIVSSLLTRARNNCVSAFLNSDFENFLFVDSDIQFDASSVFKLLNSPYDVASIPYPLKWVKWDKAKRGLLNLPEGKLGNMANTYTLKKTNPGDAPTKDGWLQVDHATTGFLLVRRKAFEKMIEAYPDLKINNPSQTTKGLTGDEQCYNFFDCIFDKKTGYYYGEDFSFCKLWREIGGKIFANVNDYMAHCGRHEFIGRYRDEFTYDFSENN